MTDREIVRTTGKEIEAGSNGETIVAQDTMTFRCTDYKPGDLYAEGARLVTYLPYEWKDEDSDRILVRIVRIKEDGHHQEQYIPLEKFKELLKG